MTAAPSQPPPGDPVAPFDVDLTWLAVRAREVNDVTTAVQLTLVGADGTMRWRAALEPPNAMGGLVIAGPRNGVLVYGTQDGDEMVLRAVRAVDGSDTELARLEGLVVGAVLDRLGENVFVAVSTADVVVSRISVATGEPISLANALRRRGPARIGSPEDYPGRSDAHTRDVRGRRVLFCAARRRDA